MENPQTPEELARIHEQLWQTVLQFGNFSALQERNRIARDLHDSLGQALTALNIQLQTAVKLWQLDPQRAEEFLAEAQRLGSTAVKEVRQTVKTLRTDTPEGQAIETLMATLVESFQRSTGVLPQVYLNLAGALPPEVVTPIYRIIQESLNNICKYAQATAVEIQLSTTQTSLGLIIQDNGRGFNLAQTEQGFGLRGMQERVSMLRGQLQVETEPGAGCCIRVTVPLRIIPIDQMANMPSGVGITDPDRGVVMPDDSPIGATPPSPLSPVPDHASPTAQLGALTLKAGDRDRLTTLLVNLIGPIAPMLVQTTSRQVQTVSELLEQLALHIPTHQHQQFFQQTEFLSLVTSQTPTWESHAPSPDPTQVPKMPAISSPASPQDPSLNHGLSSEVTGQCERELTTIIGPIARFLVQDAMAQSSGLRLEEFVDLLAAQIPDHQKARQFKQRILTQGNSG